MRSRHTTGLWLTGALAALALSACGTSSSTQDASTTADTPTADRGTAPADGSATNTDAAVGAFQVQMVAPTDASAGYTTVVGRVQDGPTPSQIVWQQAATEGDCRLLTPRVPFCATSCGERMVCVENDTCQPYPVAQSVGAVRVTGVRSAAGATTFEMIAVSNSYQTPGDVMLPYPAFAEGDMIRVEAAGSPWTPAFTLDARGIAPFALGAAPLRIQTGQGVALTWTAPQQSGQRVHVRLDISHHGGTRGKIECATNDDGELTIPAALISRLVALGVAGFPTIVVGRTSTGSASVRAGRVELTITSETEVPIEVPGVRSCTDDSECDGGMCRPDLTCG